MMTRVSTFFLVSCVFLCSTSFASRDRPIDHEISEELLALECAPGRLELVSTRAWKAQGDVWPFRSVNSVGYYDQLKGLVRQISPRSARLFFMSGPHGTVSKSTALGGGHFSAGFPGIPSEIDGCPTRILIADLRDQYRYREQYLLDQEGYDQLSRFDQYVFRQRVAGLKMGLIRMFSNQQTLSLPDEERIKGLGKGGSLSAIFNGYEITADIGDKFNRFEDGQLLETILILPESEDEDSFPENFMHALFYRNGIMAVGTSRLWRVRSQRPLPNPVGNLYWETNMIDGYMFGSSDWNFKKKQTVGEPFLSPEESEETFRNCSGIVVYREDGSLQICQGDYFLADGTRKKMKTPWVLNVGGQQNPMYNWFRDYDLERWFPNVKPEQVKGFEYVFNGVSAKLYGTEKLVLSFLEAKPTGAKMVYGENCSSNEIQLLSVEEDPSRSGKFLATFEVPGGGCSGILQISWEK